MTDLAEFPLHKNRTLKIFSAMLALRLGSPSDIGA
jgi:hypothetical protein